MTATAKVGSTNASYVPLSIANLLSSIASKVKNTYSMHDFSLQAISDLAVPTLQ